MPKTEFDYYYGVEAEQFTFVRVPKVLFTDKEHFGGLSNEAKLLYGLLLERMSLSRKNNWIDKHNRVYIIFLPVEEIEESLDVGHEKALNLLKELDDQSGIGLVKKKCRGLGLPSILYVKNFIVKGEQNTDRVPTSRSTENEFQEFGKTDFKKSENQTSENPKNRLLEVRKSDSNNIDINNTDMSYTYDQSIDRSQAGIQNFSPGADGLIDAIERSKEYKCQGGKKIIMKAHFGHRVYKDVNIPIPYTGKILLGDGFMREYYIHMGFQRGWAYKKLIELVFEEGILLECNDLSHIAKAQREAMVQGNINPQRPDVDILSKFVDDSFSLDYADKAWWME